VEWQPLAIRGVWHGRLTVHPDQRGSFMELWRASGTEGLPEVAPGTRMRQANLSRSQARVLRGLHVHRRQADLWIVTEGSAFVGLVDTRPAIRGDGDPVSIGVEVGVGEALYLPEGVAHGFYAREALALVYLVTNEYDGTDELGFAWNDPLAGVAWPDSDPIVSARDATAPPLADLLVQLRGG
jgi:dTDP-4-dehydrorhamnose 3,5-epimerase